MLADLEAFEEGRAVSALDECPVTRMHRWFASRSPAVARMRNVDVDLIAWSSLFLGVFSGAAAAYWAPSWTVPIAVISLALALLAALRPLYTIWRRPRPDDPGGPLAGGTVGTTGRSPSTWRGLGDKSS